MQWTVRGRVIRLRLICCGKGGLEPLNLRSTLCALLLGSCLLVFLHVLISFESVDESVYFSSLPIPDDPDIPTLGIKLVEDLPTSGAVRIPKRIHQTWKTDQVPYSMVTWIKSWKQNHPDWEYWLWTDKSARALIQERHPHLLDMFDNYPNKIQRADALRYVVLLEFGGVYADLDMESLRPIDPLARRYSCFVGQEPYTHPMLDTHTSHLVINALIACRPGHPFMKMAVNSLPDFAHMWSYLDATGPHFLSNIFHRYTRERQHASPTHENGAYLAPAEYFYPKMDPDKFVFFYWRCKKYKDLRPVERSACQQLKRTQPEAERMALAFTNHHWIHTYLIVKVSLRRPVPIREIVPNVKIYTTGGS